MLQAGRPQGGAGRPGPKAGCSHLVRGPPPPTLPPPPPPPRSNAKISSTIADVEGGLGAMQALGWQFSEEGGEEVLTLPKGAASMAQVGRLFLGCEDSSTPAAAAAAVAGRGAPQAGQQPAA